MDVAVATASNGPVLAAECAVQAMTIYRSGASSSSRCGGYRFFGLRPATSGSPGVWHRSRRDPRADGKHHGPRRTCCCFPARPGAYPAGSVNGIAHRVGAGIPRVEWVVQWGLEHRSLEGITAIGVDEIQYSKGHNYLTLVDKIDAGCVRLLWTGRERTMKTFRRFFDLLGKERSSRIEFVCSDMWKPYLRVINSRVHQPPLPTALTSRPRSTMPAMKTRPGGSAHEAGRLGAGKKTRWHGSNAKAI